MMVRFVLISGGKDEGLGRYLEKYLSGIEKTMSTTSDGKTVIEVCESMVDRTKSGVKRAMLEALLAAESGKGGHVKTVPAASAPRCENGSREFVFQMAQNC
jgi:hypothetical protein